MEMAGEVIEVQEENSLIVVMEKNEDDR